MLQPCWLLCCVAQPDVSREAALVEHTLWFLASMADLGAPAVNCSAADFWNKSHATFAAGAW